MKTVIIALLCLAVFLFAENPRRPFPQAGEIQMTGSVIRPNRSQADLNQDVIAKYNAYKVAYLRRTSNGKYYIEASGTDGGRARTISEAHGYGMMIFALMAGHDPEAKVIFDGMNALRKAQRSRGNPNLMSWVVTDVNSTGGVFDYSATDGDLDNAYALLLTLTLFSPQKHNLLKFNNLSVLQFFFG